MGAQLTMLAVLCCFSSSCSEQHAHNASDGNGVIELELWHGLELPHSIRVLESKIAEFERQNPNIRVRSHHSGESDLLIDELLNAIAEKKAPDLLWWGPHVIGFLVSANQIIDLDAFIAADVQFDRNDIYDTIWRRCEYMGRLYAVPFDANTLGILYNRELFQEEGIDPDAIENWTDFLEAAKRLTKDTDNDGLVDQYGFQIPFGRNEWTVWIWQTQLWATGGKFVTNDLRRPAFNSSAGRQALQWWVDLVYKYKVAYLSERNSGHRIDDLISGKAAMVVNGSWNLPFLLEARENKAFDFGSFPLPRNIEFSNNLGGESIYLFRTDDSHRDAQWQFAKFIMSKDFQIDWAIKTGYLPISKSAATDVRYRRFVRVNPFIETFLDQMPLANVRPNNLEYLIVSKSAGVRIEEALRGRTSVSEALDTAEEDANRALSFWSQLALKAELNALGSFLPHFGRCTGCAL